MSLDDRILHYILVGLGLTVGSFLKALWDALAEKFWDTEWQQFQRWKASQSQN